MNCMRLLPPRVPTGVRLNFARVSIGNGDEIALVRLLNQ